MQSRQNQIVLHFLNGEIVKGNTHSFYPDRKWFLVTDRSSGQTIMVDTAKLKAIFFVKTFDGNPAYRERYDIERTGLGKKVLVSFKDGETLIGYTTALSPDRTGFYLFVSDPLSNNEKVFVITAAAEDVLLK